MKRNIPILFIALGAGLMLLHSIVPHHHHNGEVCFVEMSNSCCLDADRSKPPRSSSPENHTHKQFCDLLNDLTQAEKFRLPNVWQVQININPLKGLFFTLNRLLEVTVRLDSFQSIRFTSTPKCWLTPLIASRSFRAPPF